MPTLVIDASSPTLFVGVAQGGRWLVLREEPIGALEGLFDLSLEIFSKFPLQEMGGVALCEGPGRLMSLRVAAVAANEWTRGTNVKKEVYNSLQLASLQSCGEPMGYFVREGACVAWLKGAPAVVPSADGLTMINQNDFEYRLDGLPNLLARISRPVDSFNPPIFAPVEFAVAKNFSKE